MIGVFILLGYDTGSIQNDCIYLFNDVKEAEEFMWSVFLQLGEIRVVIDEIDGSEQFFTKDDDGDFESDHRSKSDIICDLQNQLEGLDFIHTYLVVDKRYKKS